MSWNPYKDYYDAMKSNSEWSGVDTENARKRIKDLEEAAKECNSNLQLQEYFIKGGIWQKEQMMKEAVEGKVFMSFAPGCNQRVVSTQDVDLPCETKVKLIIVKED